MKLVIRIALRYLLALRRASTVQLLSTLSLLGVFLGSMSLLLVLSAFNGFESLLRSVHHHQDPDLRILPAKGKSFSLPAEKWQAIRNLNGLLGAFEILSDKASIQYGEGQMIAGVFAADPAYFFLCRLDTTLRAGKYSVKAGEPDFGLVSEGIRQSLQVSFNDVFTFLKLAYPKKSKILKPGSGKIFNTLVIKPLGSLAIDDNRVFIPLSAGRRLMEKPSGCHFIDVFLHAGTGKESIRMELSSLLGPEYLVLDENELHADLYKVMKIEKLFVFLAVGFIILISGFNLFVSSSMMVLNKTKDFSILAALGMESGQFGVIIRATGLFLVLAGLLPGLAAGAGLVFLQQTYGMIPLGMSSTQILAYPVELQFSDALAVCVWVLFSGLLALMVPAARAAALRLKV